jgi:hypothetical protein
MPSLDERRQGCLAKVDQLRMNNKVLTSSSDAILQQPSCTADFTLSGLRFPLNPEFISKLKNKPDRQCHAFFCLVRLDESSVTGTNLISTNDQEKTFSGGLKFANKIILHGACPNFKISIELYGMKTCMSRQEFRSLHGTQTTRQRLQSMLASVSTVSLGHSLY